MAHNGITVFVKFRYILNYSWFGLLNTFFFVQASTAGKEEGKRSNNHKGVLR